MSNASPAWGILVGNLLISGRTTCQHLSTVHSTDLLVSASDGGKTIVIPELPVGFTNFFTQRKQSITPLLRSVVLHISTTPITTTNKKG